MATLFRMNVRWVEMHPEIEEARRKLEKLASPHDLIVTSARDSKHGTGSYHMSGRAFDVRKKGLTLHGIREVLGLAKFDIVPHDTHFHIEYDPH